MKLKEYYSSKYYMCNCNRSQPRRVQPTSNFISRNQPRIISSSATRDVPPSNNSASIQTMDPDRLRIEQLRREAFRRAFGN